MLLVGLCATLVEAADDAKPADGEQALYRRFVDELIVITPGKGKFPKSFQMGSDSGEPSERPEHKVTFDYSFSIPRYEVPQNWYTAVMCNDPSRWKGPRNSAEMMTWAEANQFCASLTKKLQSAKLIGEDEVIRLPSEAEWEYCCRAGTTTRYSFGDAAQAPGQTGTQAAILDKYGWHTGNAAGNDPPVGALQPNPWGLYDVHGYLWEFTADTWAEDYADAPTDGRPRVKEGKKTAHVMRGGSWRDPFGRLTSTSRIATPETSDAARFR